MLTQNQKDLLAFLAESALETALRGRNANIAGARALMNEAEELMTLRSKLLNNHWNVAKANQFELPLPFAMKRAA